MSANNNPLVNDSAVQAIKDSVRTETINVEGRDYVTRPVHFAPTKPNAETLEIKTLKGVVDFIKTNIDRLELPTLAIHVSSHAEVRVVSNLRSDNNERHDYLVATCEGCSFPFDQFMDHETFIIKIQSLFVETDDKENLLSLVGNIKEEAVKQANDDGITQTITARKGIVRVEEVEVKNPWTLQPFRTFREISQPSSDFILRMRQKEGSLPLCALFEADGGEWKLWAIERIRTFFEEANLGVAIIA